MIVFQGDGKLHRCNGVMVGTSCHVFLYRSFPIISLLSFDNV